MLLHFIFLSFTSLSFPALSFLPWTRQFRTPGQDVILPENKLNHVFSSDDIAAKE